MELKEFKESPSLSVFEKYENFQLTNMWFEIYHGQQQGRKKFRTVDWLFMIRTLNVMYVVAGKVEKTITIQNETCIAGYLHQNPE